MADASGPFPFPRCETLPRFAGHRGLAAHAPENTLAGIRMAASRGLRWIEFDAKLTADNIVILMHDDTVDRTTDGSGAVASMDFDAIRRLDAGGWFGPAFRNESVPTLIEALDLLKSLDMGVNVEIKPCPGREMETAGAVASVLLEHWPAARGRIVVSSFSRAALARFRDLAPDLPRGLLVWDRTGPMLDDAAALGCGSIHCTHRYLTRSQAAAIKRDGYGLIVYTVNDPVLAARLIDWGADTIISDTDGLARDTMPSDQQGSPAAA